MTDTFNKTFIRLIPKTSDKIKDTNLFRPITLSNFEYRILTKCIVNRLHSVSHLLVDDTQTCAMLGRRLTENIVISRDLMADVRINNYTKKVIKKTLYIISVDQEIAFDSIDNKYLMAMIDHINLGDFITKNIKRI